MSIGLGVEGHHVLAELHSDTWDKDGLDMAMDVVEELPGDDMEWESLPDGMKDDEAFVTTVQDIVGSE